MTAFDKSKITIEGPKTEKWVHYGKDFVARFKCGKPARNANDFVKFLVKNFSVEEYFDLRHRGYTPLGALETKGYEGYNARKIREEREKAGA